MGKTFRYFGALENARGASTRTASGKSGMNAMIENGYSGVGIELVAIDTRGGKRPRNEGDYYMDRFEVRLTLPECPPLPLAEIRVSHGGLMRLHLSRLASMWYMGGEMISKNKTLYEVATDYDISMDSLTKMTY